MNDLNVSIVIPTYNRINYLKYCITSLEMQTYKKHLMEIIVVDNSSTDGTKEWIGEKILENKELEIKYINEEKIDIFEAAKLRNIGVDAARGEVIIFIDSDIIVSKDFVENHLVYYRKPTDNICVVGSVVYLKEADIKIDELEDVSKLRDRAFDYVDPLESDILYCNENLHTHPFPWMISHSGNLSTTKNCIKSCGKFDEWHKRWSIEDIDFGFTLYKNNVKFFFTKKGYGLHIFHPVHSTEEKYESAIDGYYHLKSKNPSNSSLEAMLKLQINELREAKEGTILTGRYRRDKYRSLKMLIDRNYILPEITFALYITSRDFDKAIHILEKLDKQFSNELPFEVIIINDSENVEVEYKLQSIDFSFDLRIFSVGWEREIRSITIDELRIKRILMDPKIEQLEKKLLYTFTKGNEFAKENIQNRFEKFIYPKGFGKVIKYITTQTGIGPNFVEEIRSEIKLNKRNENEKRNEY